MYIGELTYLGRPYRFTINKGIMRLNHLDNGEPIFMVSVSGATGVYISDLDEFKLKTDYFIGVCYENANKIIIFPKADTFGCKNCTLTLQIAHVIEFTGDVRKIAGISFSCEELDWIYDVKQFVGHKGYLFTSDDKDEHTTVYIDGFAKTTTDIGNVNVNGINVSCQLGLSLTRSFSKTPISLQASLRLCFEETDDYIFLLDLIWNVEKLLQFLCYRRNINFTAIKFEEYSIGAAAEFQQSLRNLASNESSEQENDECAEKKYYSCAKLVESELFTRVEDKEIVEKRYIPHCSLDGKLPDIFQDVVDGKLHRRHIPDTFSLGNRITPANFIMTMAAFEGEYDRLNPPESQKPKRVKAQNAIRATLEKLIEDTTGEEKGIYNRFLNQVEYRPLMDEIYSSMKKYLGVIQVFGKYRYSAEEFDLQKIAKRLADQRDAFAHGNLAKPFEMESVHDIRLLECLIFTMQLSKYEIPNENIIGIIKKLFKVNIVDGITYV